MGRWGATYLAMAALVACDLTDDVSERPEPPSTTGVGEGRPRDAGAAPGADAAAEKPTTGDIVVDQPAASPCALEAEVRDFKAEHPDFEGQVNTQVITGLVEAELGSDGKPRVRDGAARAAGIQAFADWYNDREGLNTKIPISLSLAETTRGVFVFDSDAFFPIDGRGFGKEERPHNYHFTTEIHTRFVYRGGERFTFAGDDDVWVFINGKLAIDLGGVRARAMATVDLDAMRAQLGIAPGQKYTMDIFHAERHTVESNFRIETTIECFQSVI